MNDENYEDKERSKSTPTAWPWLLSPQIINRLTERATSQEHFERLIAIAVRKAKTLPRDVQIREDYDTDAFVEFVMSNDARAQ
jgi:hypothetical protein